MKKLADLTEPELQNLMRCLAISIDIVTAELGVEKAHFALLLFNDPKVAQYVCNCVRSDMVAAFREAADRLENREDVPR